MPFSTMCVSVLQATSLTIASTIFTHRLSSSMLQTFFEDEALKSWIELTANITAPTASPTAGQLLTLETGAIEPINSANGTALTNSTVPRSDKQMESFYSRELPRQIVVQFVLMVLQYYWFIYLEKLLPARPRRKVYVPEGKEKSGENDFHEEEVINKWIAQGRVRRASLNWCNTFLKWILTVTVWRMIGFSCTHFLTGTLHLKGIGTMLSEYKAGVLLDFFTASFTIAPIAELVAFVVIPAYKQAVFIAGTKLMAQVFVMAVVQMFASWVVKSDMMQEMLRNMTSEVNKAKARQEFFERYEGEL